jgi:hypothetical protein
LTDQGRDKTERIVDACVTDIVSEDNDFVGTMFILRDLTQIRRLQATVQKQEKLAAIGNLAAGSSPRSAQSPQLDQGLCEPISPPSFEPRTASRKKRPRS